MDFMKLLEIAGKVATIAPGLVGKGIEFVNEVKAAAERTPHVLTSADKAELDQIHADALAAADRLDAKLAEAEKR